MQGVVTAAKFVHTVAQKNFSFIVVVGKTDAQIKNLIDLRRSNFFRLPSHRLGCHWEKHVHK